MNRAVLIPMIENEMKKKLRQYGSRTCVVRMCRAGPVNRIDEVFAMEQTQHRGMEISMDHPAAPKP
jgi:crotonobetainyl-CoA:carnitine CoA-transferase CaiB-like acyl-CoA transferase